MRCLRFINGCARTSAATGAAAIAAVAVVVAAPTFARATTMEPLSTRQLVWRADTIVEGTVVAQRVLRLDGRLWTESHVRVARQLKPAGGPEAGHSALLRIRQLGGEAGDQGLSVDGVATFRVGEHVVVFSRLADGHHVVVGGCLGKYTVVRDRKGVERVTRDLSDVRFVRPSRTGRLVVVPAARELGAPLPELTRLRATVATIVADTSRTSGGGR